MKRVFERINERSAQIDRHPFIALLHGVDADGAHAVLSRFALSFVHLSMTFRDINEMYLAYDEPKNVYERIIDSHAREDAKHWRFLQQDLQSLSLNSSRTASGYMEVFWQDGDSYIRDYIYSVLARARSCGDSAIKRMAAMESAEAGVRAFFSAVRRNARLIQEARGIQLIYFGDHHIDTEIETRMDIAPFKEIELDDALLAECLALVDDHFESNREFLDNKLLAAKALLEQHARKEAIVA